MVSTRSQQIKIEPFVTGTPDEDDSKDDSKKRTKPQSETQIIEGPSSKKAKTTAPHSPKEVKAEDTGSPPEETKGKVDQEHRSVEDKTGADSSRKISQTSLGPCIDFIASSKQEPSEPPLVKLKSHDDTDEKPELIKINRAPVLHLFAACAAHFQHPDLPWSTCLSLGSAVAGICAISKGRAIGEIPEKKEGEPNTHRQDETVEVLGFQIPVRDGVGFVGEQKKPPNEGYLKSKFGERYEEVRKTTDEALTSWKGHEESFNKGGFHLYERFRPGSGQWGAEGGLEVDKIRRVITR